MGRGYLVAVTVFDIVIIRGYGVYVELTGSKVVTSTRNIHVSPVIAT